MGSLHLAKREAMTEDQMDQLVFRLYETFTPLQEALDELGITEPLLEVEDALMVENVEQCVECGMWLGSNQLENDSEEPICRKCLTEG